MARKTTNKPPPQVAPNALAYFARIFWDEAVREVEARIDAEDATNAKRDGKDNGQREGVET
jgi:hypothetical protein